MRIGIFQGSLQGLVSSRFCGQLWRHSLPVLWVLTLALFCGCASFPRNKLPSRTARDLAVPSQKKSVDCNIHVSFPRSNHQLLLQNAGDVAAYNKAIFDALNGSGQFSRVVRGKGDSKYYFDVWVGWSSSGMLDFVNVEFAVLSLTLIPSFNIDTCELIVGVYKDGKFIRACEYEDSVTTWCQLFLALGTSEIKPRNVRATVIGNMINNLLFDLSKDGIL